MKALAVLSCFLLPALFLCGFDFKPQRDCQEELNQVYKDNDSLRQLLSALRENLNRFPLGVLPYNLNSSTATSPTDLEMVRVTYTFYKGRLGIRRVKPFLGIGPSAGVQLNSEGRFGTYLGVGVNFNILSLH